MFLQNNFNFIQVVLPFTEQGQFYLSFLRFASTHIGFAQMLLRLAVNKHCTDSDYVQISCRLHGYTIEDVIVSLSNCTPAAGCRCGCGCGCGCGLIVYFLSSVDLFWFAS